MSETCNECGGPLSADEIKWEHAACYACRSPMGKVAELVIALQSPSGDPNRILLAGRAIWPTVRILVGEHEQWRRVIHDTIADRKDVADWLVPWLRERQGLADPFALSLERLLEILRGVAPPATDSGAEGEAGEEEVEWSRPMSKKEAAKLLKCPHTKKSEWITKLIEDGTLRAKQMTRQTWRFDLSTVDQAVRDQFR